MALRLENYLRMEHLPHMWCPGCGIGIIVKALLRAVEAIQWSKDDTAVISGIGCTSRAPGYLDMNTLHTTHGRALTFATGVKLARSDKHVVVISGDGDASAIGGNHLIHSCRRNIDITCIIVNNNIYGMTGGQFSPTTPLGAKAATAPYGMSEPAFDLSKLAIGAGASYVARGHVGSAAQLERLIRGGLKHHGFSVIEVLSNCHTQFGRRNRLADPMELIEHIAARTVNVKEAAKLSPEELREKSVVGLLHQDESREEYCDSYDRIIARAQAQG
ncbi:MAG: 2-oxoacid:ferredoxin oxidoreductase subunit beta [Calditrichaeota bacterium]|nr:2-oxoacid:ferredoxin oxidoreductase subunit beta [Calditrichota bacterium]